MKKYIVLTGKKLEEYTKPVLEWEQRDVFSEYIKFLLAPYEKTYNTVAILYGLRRTGKTTMMKQAAALVGCESSAIIEILSDDVNIEEIDHLVDELIEKGITYLFF